MQNEYLLFYLVLAVTWEPGFKIVFLGGGIIKSTRDDVNDSVRELKGFHEFFRDINHSL
jgi:hypothetical protein